MSAVLVEANTFGSAFRAASTQRSKDPSWLRQLREQSFERFEALGFPTVDQEEWKYTNTAPIVKSGLKPVIAANGLSVTDDALASFEYHEARDTRLVFLNGIFRQELSSTSGLPSGNLSATILRSGASIVIAFTMESRSGFVEPGLSVRSTP